MKRNISQNEENDLYIDKWVVNKLIRAEGLKPAHFIMKSKKQKILTASRFFLKIKLHKSTGNRLLNYKIKCQRPFHQDF